MSRLQRSRGERETFLSFSLCKKSFLKRPSVWFCQSPFRTPAARLPTPSESPRWSRLRETKTQPHLHIWTILYNTPNTELWETPDTTFELASGSCCLSGGRGQSYKVANLLVQHRILCCLPMCEYFRARHLQEYRGMATSYHFKCKKYKLRARCLGPVIAACNYIY